MGEEREREIANANERKSEGLGGVYIGKERAERERERGRVRDEVRLGVAPLQI